jgi:RNA recognition motif-containing protein
MARTSSTSSSSSYAPSTSSTSSHFSTSTRRSNNPRKAPTPSYTIMLDNLPHGTTQEQLYDLCRAYGPVRRVVLPSLPYCSKTGAVLREAYAFVHFLRQDSAEAALAGLQGLRLERQLLSAEWARPRRKEGWGAGR